MTERRKNTESAGHGRPTEPPTIKDGPRPSRSPLVIRVPPGLVERILTEGPGMCGVTWDREGLPVIGTLSVSMTEGNGCNWENT